MFFWIVWSIITLGGLAGILYGVIENSIILGYDYPYVTSNVDAGYDDNGWDSGAGRADDLVAYFKSNDKSTGVPLQCDGPGARTEEYSCGIPAKTCCSSTVYGACHDLGSSSYLTFECCPSNPHTLARDQWWMIGAVIFSGAIALVTNAMQL